MTVIDEAPTAVGVPLGAEERGRFEQDGFLLVPGALDAAEVDRAVAAVDAVARQHGRPLHRLGAVSAAPDLLALVDHHAVLGRVVSILGWNVHVYHSHVDVHPPAPPDEPDRYVWHQDGGPQNRDLETDPRPRLSVKVAWWLSDVSVPGRGNLEVVPGSHRRNRFSRPTTPDDPWPRPEGAVPILARPGDAVLFDRRLWHARSPNRSAMTRRAAFFAYTYRWIAARERLTVDLADPTPVQRQLLGTLETTDPDHAWGHHPDTVPLHAAVTRSGA